VVGAEFIAAPRALVVKIELFAALTTLSHVPTDVLFEY